MSEELVALFKALADASRVKIVGLLANQPYSVEELAALLNLKASTVSHHLTKLSKAGLVSAKADGYYNVYQLNQSVLEEKTRDLFSQQNMNDAVADLNLDAYDDKVLKDFSKRDGSLKTIPAQRKKLEAVLRHIVKVFKPEKQYSEKQVNELLSNYHEDTATLRRELVGNGLMNRKDGVYWKK